MISNTYIKFEDEVAPVGQRRSDRYASENEFPPIIKTESNIQISLNDGPTLHRTSFSLMLAFPCTGHKMQ